MKICVLGNGLLAKEFKNMNFTVIDEPFEEFNINTILDFDVIINTHNYMYEPDNETVDLSKLKKCNIDLPFLIAEFCHTRRKRYVHLSTGRLYDASGNTDCSEHSEVCIRNSYYASQLLGESCCGKKDLIIRTLNMFNGEIGVDNALYRAIINTKPTKNVESYAWTVDVVRGIVSLLSHKEHGIFNIASLGHTSQADMCEMLEISNVAPVLDPNSIPYVKLRLDKLNRNIIPSRTHNNILNCFKELEENLKS